MQSLQRGTCGWSRQWAVLVVGPRRASCLEAIDIADDEDDEGDDEEVNHVVEELPVGDDGDAPRLRVGERDGDALRRVERVEEAREIDPAEDESDGRHDDALDERGDDLAEGRRDDHGDGQIHHVAAVDELPELFKHFRLP